MTDHINFISIAFHQINVKIHFEDRYISYNTFVVIGRPMGQYTNISNLFYFKWVSFDTKIKPMESKRNMKCAHNKFKACKVYKYKACKVYTFHVSTTLYLLDFGTESQPSKILICSSIFALRCFQNSTNVSLDIFLLSKGILALE